MDARPRFLHILATFEAGGVQLRTRELIAKGTRAHHVLVTLDGGATDPEHVLAPYGFEWMPLPKSGSLSSIPALARVMRRVRPDLVLTYDWGAIDAVVANRLSMRAPLVHHEDGACEDEVDGEKTRRRIARRVVLRWADRVIVPSTSRANSAMRSWRISEARLVHIPNGVDSRRFSVRAGRDSLFDHLKIPSDALIVGAVSRLAPEKRLDRLLSAFAMLPRSLGVHLVIAGDGPERAALQQQAGTLAEHARVHWLGHVADPERVFGSLDAWVLTSDREEHPRALLEAMSCGCPVVAMAVGDVPRIVPPEQRRFLIEPTSRQAVADIAAALVALLTDRATRSALSHANRQCIVSRFPQDQMLARYRSVYDTVLSCRT